MNNFIIQIKNLSKKYDSQMALQNINFNIKKGEICAIIGNSGCGKSTLLKIIGLLDNDFEGIILFEDQDISKISTNNKRSIRKYKIGFVYQFHFLIPELTIAQNIALSLSLHNTKPSVKKEKIISLLNKINLLNKIDNFPYELSGGEKQRVAIARALAHNPAIIIADEPTGNLDVNNTKNTFQLLINMAKNNNTTIIIATHNNKIAEQCDKIINLTNQSYLQQQI